MGQMCTCLCLKSCYVFVWKMVLCLLFQILVLVSLMLIVQNSIWTMYSNFRVFPWPSCTQWLIDSHNHHCETSVVCCLKILKVPTSVHWLLCSRAMGVPWQIGRECRQFLLLPCTFLFSSSSPNAALCTREVKIQQLGRN